MALGLSWLGSFPPLVAGTAAPSPAIGSVFLRWVFGSAKNLIEVKGVEWRAFGASSKQFIQIILVDAISLPIPPAIIAESIGIAKLSVVFLPLLRMIQHPIGFLNLEEHRTCSRIGIDIRVILRCLPMIGFLDLNPGGITGYFQQLVVIQFRFPGSHDDIPIDPDRSHGSFAVA